MHPRLEPEDALGRRRGTATSARHGLALVLVAATLVLGGFSARAAVDHTVRKNETLEGIGKRYGVSWSAIARANGLKNPDRLSVGQKLRIPGGTAASRGGGAGAAKSTGVRYVVRPGDTLGEIAARNGVRLLDLARHNRITRPDRLAVGQVLLIPPRTGRAGGGGKTLPTTVRREVDGARVRAGRWKTIVIHHTGTSAGSAAGIDAYHRKQRHMANGLAYHFLIGNGSGMPDGAIHVGGRWKGQLDGGHLKSERANQTSIGICLVGNFQSGRPTRRQLDSLEALSRHLMRKTGLAKDRVTTHKLAHPRHTACPGKNFPLEALRKRLP